MFKGKAELTNPGDGELVATFHETCHHDGKAVATVRFRSPITLKGTEQLEIVGNATSTPIMTVGASDPDGTEIREFHGKSEGGCIHEGGEITLVRTPGGLLGSLLIVMGKGTVERSH